MLQTKTMTCDLMLAAHTMTCELGVLGSFPAEKVDASETLKKTRVYRRFLHSVLLSPMVYRKKVL
jgi:hypothetical protein